ncbi:MAG: sodium:alanine symporter family protein [Planctomycetes bacterium]|nr:sodium:alanine symporter family protein [Planctomycetota bacterium]
MKPFMDQLNWVLEESASRVWGIPLIVLLVGTGLVLSVVLKLIQIRKYPLSVGIISGKYDDPEEKGEISHFRALTSALSATIGLGNIAGVAVAISLGGPGALLWMWLTATIGMATKYSTCLLSLKYRTIHEDGTVGGGPMFTIVNGLGAKWKPLAVAFAIFTMAASFGMANMFQANQMANVLHDAFCVPPWITGIAVVIFVSLVIIGGIKRIGAVTSKLVPFMCVVYVVAALTVLVIKASAIPEAIALIFTTAFTGIKPAAGGFAGIVFMTVLQQGMRRGTFSNESGLGSAPIAHAAAKTQEPVREGLVAMMGPFIDTILICSMTALVIITTGTWKMGDAPRVQGTEMTKIEADAHPAPTGPTVHEGRKQVGKEVAWSGEVIDVRIFPFKHQIVVKTGDGMHQTFFAESAPEQNWAGKVSPGDRVLIKGKIDGKVDGAVITSFAFGWVLGKAGIYLVVLAVCLFALSTAISWSYYGDRCADFLWGATGVKVYRLLFVIVLFIGSVYKLDAVVNFSDACNGLMAVPNLIVTLALLPVVVRETKDYFRRYPHT